MKSLFVTMALVFTSQSFAGTEIIYLTPFSKNVSVFSSHKPAQIAIDSARLVDAPTQVLLDDSTCDLDSTSFCPQRKVVETVKAVEVNISYVDSTSDDGLVLEKLYLDPTTLPSYTVAALPATKALNSKKASALFAIKTQPTIESVKAVDYQNSVICEEVIGSHCQEEIVYIQKSVQKIKITVEAK